MKELKNLKAIIFDFDETLYSHGDWSRANEFFVRCSVKLGFFEDINIAIETIKNMFPEENDFNKKMVKFFIQKGLSPKQYKSMLEDQEVYDMKSERLEKMDYSLFDELSKHYKLYIVSDSPQKYINFYLDDFKINRNNFEMIIVNPFSPEDTTKTPCMKRAIENANVNASEILMIGDNYSLDIVPAEKLGMNAVHVKSVKETETLVKRLIFEKTKN